LIPRNSSADVGRVSKNNAGHLGLFHLATHHRISFRDADNHLLLMHDRWLTAWILCLSGWHGTPIPVQQNQGMPRLDTRQK